MTGPLASRLATGAPLLIDGAMGTELDRRGARTYLPLWSAWGLIEAPDLVREIHRDYLVAGADILVTNTFRTTGRMLARAERDPSEAYRLDRLAVHLAREAGERFPVQPLVAGSIAPLEDCYSPWLSPDPEIAFAEHQKQATSLVEAGVEFLLIETMPLIAEAVAATRAAIETGLEVVVGFVIGDNGRLLSGETIEAAVRALAGLPISAIVINCAPALAITGALNQLADLTTLPIGGYANLGTVDDAVGWSADTSIDGERYAHAVAPWLDAGARLIGGCCGTTPEHTRALRSLLDERARN